MARRIVIATVVLLAALHAGNALLLTHFYRSNAAREKEARTARATLLAEHASRAIGALDLSLETIADRVKSLPAKQMPSVFLQMLLDEQMRRLPQLRGIIVLDRKGMVVQDSREYPPRSRDLSDRPYFLEQQKLRGIGLYIDHPAIGRYDGKPFFGISRPILDDDGNFGGVVAAIADPGYFSSFYGSDELSRNEAAVLARNDGAILAAAASRGSAGSAADATVAEFLKQRPGDSITTRPVPGLPLQIFIAGPSPMASPAFTAFLYADATAIVAMTLVAIWLTLLLAREVEARDLAEIRLHEAIKNAPAGFALYDPRDRLVLANELYRTLFPAPTSALVVPGIGFEELMLSAIAHDMYEPGKATDVFLELLDKHRSADGELVQRLADGRWILTRERRADDGSVVSFHTDITPMKEQEQALRLSEQAERAARERAESADRAKSTFLATMSHELRTPLNAVIGFSEVIEQRLFGPAHDRYHEYSALIRKSGQHLLSIINDILDIAKLQSGKTELYLEPLEVRQVIQDALQLVSKQAQATGISLRCDATDGLPTIAADVLRLRQVLLNLLSNAIKFSFPGGTITVGARQQDRLVRIDVTDTGIGMSSDEIPKALEPFGQITSAFTRRQQGTGLGLPLAKNLVELHGGRFEIDSTPGVGTTVSIFLPIPPHATEGVRGDARRAIARPG